GTATIDKSGSWRFALRVLTHARLDRLPLLPRRGGAVRSQAGRCPRGARGRVAHERGGIAAGADRRIPIRSSRGARDRRGYVLGAAVGFTLSPRRRWHQHHAAGVDRPCRGGRGAVLVEHRASAEGVFRLLSGADW